MRILFAAAMLLAASPAAANTADGTVLSYDARTRTLVLDNKTVWHLGTDTIVPPSLAPGDRITLDYTYIGNSGAVSVEAITSQAQIDV